MTYLSPSQLEDHLGYWLRCLSNAVHYGFSNRLKAHHISVAQWVVLRTLYEKDSLTLQEAARLIGVDKSTLSRMVERLIDKKLLCRQEGKDRRSVKLTLTQEGREKVPLLAHLADINDEAFFQTLSSKQRQKAIEVIKSVLHANGWDHTQQGRDKMV